MKHFQAILLYTITAMFLVACGGGGTGTPPPAGPSDPSVPQNVQAMPGDKKVTLSWEPVSGAETYNIYWDTSGGVTTTSGTQIKNVTLPYTHSGLTNDTKTYYYIITAVNTVGEGKPSVEVSTKPYLYTVYFVSSTTGDDSFDGLSRDAAKVTIPAAITAAVADNALPAIVQVNKGTYEVNSGASTPTHVVLTEGVSLYGGYSSNFDVRDPSTNLTIITDTSITITDDTTIPSSVLEAGKDISVATIVDGFILNGSQSGAGYTTAIWTHDGGSPTVKNNTLNGGDGKFSSGMHNQNSKPTVRNNTINSGGGNVSYGMYNINLSSPIVQRNTINAGKGILNYGMYNITSSPIVQNNAITGGYNLLSPLSVGIFNTATATATTSPVLQNNTINGGKGITAYGIYNTTFSTPFIDNNIITIKQSVFTSYCIHISNNPTSLLNNDLFGCSVLYIKYVDGNGCGFGDICITAIAGINALTSANANVSVNPQFKNADTNWHFSSTSPTSVTTGGLNGAESGWGYTTDKDGVIRPGAGEKWSIGAYEP